MQTTSNHLLQELIRITKENVQEAEKFSALSPVVLNARNAPKSWSILECLEHLNRYGDFYIPELEKQIKTSQHPSSNLFKSGWLGNYFAQSMLVKEGMKPIKTFASMNPIGSTLNKDVVSTFIAQQYTLLELLEKAKNINLCKTKTGISISKWIKLRLGDTLRVVIYHNQRHMVQAKKVLQKNRTLTNSR